MNKVAILLFFITSALQSSFCQNEDNVWVFGYRYTDQPVSNGIYFHFDDSLTIEYKSKPMSLKESNISICDSAGNLLLLSNGCYIETADGVMVENSDGLNPGWVYDNFCNGPYNFNYNSNNTMLLLQAPGNSSIYYLFHIRTYVTIQPLVGYYDKLFYTKIDMQENNGKGIVMFKNNPLISDTIQSDGLHAVRHANGRDWWIVAAKHATNKYYLLLISPESVTIKEQNVGEPTWSESGGEIVFSPDGTKMARFNAKDDLRIFDFNRCKGELSNPLHITIEDNADNEIFAGLAFSADGRYLYAAEVKRLLQFDMWASDVAASMVIVAEKESSPECTLGASIGYLELAPDGRIYCRPLNGQRCMHRLARPELPEKGSEFVQYYYNLEFAYKNLPHFPNFRLGPIDGSPCDTLGRNNLPLAGWRYDRTGGLAVDFTSVSWYEPEQWSWDFGDPASGNANMSAEKHPSHTFSAPGAYGVCLTVSNPFGSDTNCKTVWVTTVSLPPAPSKGEGVIVWPNPTTGEVWWSGLPEGETIMVRVYNQLGVLIAEKVTPGNFLNLSEQPDGMYLIHFQVDQRHYFSKVVKR